MKRWFWAAFATSLLTGGAVLVAAALLLGPLLAAPVPERFATGAFSFELPRGWACDRSGTEFSCSRGPAPHAAIVVLAMKMRGPKDTLADYERHLLGPMPSPSGGNTPRLIEIRRRSLNGVTWVEARWFGSEVDGYETTYLAGITAELGMLVTFSTHAASREAHTSDLNRILETVVVNQGAAERSR